MKTQIQNKILELQKEAETLTRVGKGIKQQLSDIETRLAQIVGAINALDEILQNEQSSDSSTP